VWFIFSKRQVTQDILLLVNNANEGALFINQSAEYDVAQYARNLFLLLWTKGSSAAASLYEPLGSSVDQVNVILGECSCFLSSTP
jgi:hypothetical protein